MLLAFGNFTADPSVNLQLLIGGLALGAIYAVVALGFVLVYKSTDVLNLAHGEFLMLGAYFALTFLISENLNFFLGVFVLLLVMLVFGLLVHYGIMRRMVGQGFFAIVLITLGIATIIRALLLIFYGPTERARLDLLPQGSFEIGGATVRHVDIIIFAVVAACVLLFFLFFKYTRLGLHMRAVADDIEAAAAMGIDPDKVYAMTWAAAMVMAGVGGLLFGHVTGAIDRSIEAIGLRAFPAAVVGGLTSLGGSIVGGLVVGVIEQFANGHLGTKWREPVAFSVMFVVLLVRPTGLWGRKDLERV
ncbi:MAG: branched-chain amino acid ABC transporter permease [bacterium]|nr:branched-chain amino acid ABC transporter permease [bacterium]MCY3889793.1 branched-chain amino acid ABC transporter permease [bacterium]MCY3962078.1 branched-chain amino acid ABC transporter permease [bacterium]